MFSFILQIVIHSFADGENLDGVAFLDANIYANSIISLKNFLVIGDVYQSILFLVFQVNYK